MRFIHKNGNESFRSIRDNHICIRLRCVRCVKSLVLMTVRLRAGLLDACTHDRFVPTDPGDSADRCGTVHSALRWSQPNSVIKNTREFDAANAICTYAKHSFTLLTPFIEANSRAIFASSNAFPPNTARNWNPIGTKTIPSAVIPNAIIGSIWLRCRWRARSARDV